MQKFDGKSVDSMIFSNKFPVYELEINYLMAIDCDKYNNLPLVEKYQYGYSEFYFEQSDNKVSILKIPFSCFKPISKINTYLLYMDETLTNLIINLIDY